MDQCGVYLPLMYDTVWIHQRRREQEKKQRIGWEGGEGVTDNILFNYCLNKNIVFLKKKKPIQVKPDDRERKMQNKHSFCKTKQIKLENQRNPGQGQERKHT